MALPEVFELLEPGAVLTSCVWVIAKIHGTAEKLGLRLDNLGTAIEKLERALDRHDEHLDSLGERVTRLEERAK